MLRYNDRTPKPSTREAVGKVKQNLLVRRRAAKRALVDARRTENAIEHIITLPADGESLHLVVDGRFEPCHLIPATRRLSHPAVINRLTITTLGFNSDNVYTLANGLDQGKIGHVTLVCSHYFAKSEPALYELARKELTERGSEIHGVRTHSKLILMEMSDGKNLVVEGSGNLRSCNSVEQFTFTNDRQLLEFHEKWIRDFINATSKK